MIVDVRVSVDFGQDRGQPWGNVFEARDASGGLVAGAGFASVYNTVFANDRYALQFYIRSDDNQPHSTFQRLPRSTTDAGVYLFDLGGRVYAKAGAGKAHPKGWFVMNVDLPPDADEKALMEWDPREQQWSESDLMDGRTMRLGDGAMRIRDGVLTWADSRIAFNGEPLLPAPSSGFYHHVYYANDHLIFFHNDNEKITIHAHSWNHGKTDPSSSITLALSRPREFPLCFAQCRQDVLVFTNLGGIYRLRDATWEILRTPNDESYQIYSALSTKDHLLLAHYPSGHLMSYAGGEITEIHGSPPRMQGVSNKIREAQTCFIYGGDLYVGVWPWGELWRQNLENQQWELIDRLFTHPDLTAEFDHPYEREIGQYNSIHGHNFVLNGWGQRITSMTPLEDSLLISTSAKWNWPQETLSPFMSRQQREQYGQVLQMKIPGVVTGTVRWKPRRSELSFEIDDTHMRIRQDGTLLAQRTIAPELIARISGASIGWGDGCFGKFAGTLIPTIVRL